MKRFAIDVITKQFSKRGEDICGDATKVVRTHDSTIIVVSDGLGSGVKANVLATLTVELACGLFRGELSLHEIVETLVATLPVCKWRNIAYSTFAIIKIYDNGMVTSVEYDSPGMILVRNGGKVENITGSEIQIGEKVITESHFRLQPNDMLLIFSDGIVYAGVGAGLPMGWQEEGILDYVGKLGGFLCGDCIQLAEMVSRRALSYWRSHPGDDGTVLCARYRRGKNATVLYFYPKDETPGCTKEACFFRDLMTEFDQAGAVILGVSTDSIKSHEKFAEHHNLLFPLLSDEEKKVVQDYGVWKEKQNYGKTYWGIERTTFLIDKEGIIRRIWPKVKVEGHVDEVLDAVKGLG
jgi:peroxiredoxin